jgi:hypothetical protein
MAVNLSALAGAGQQFFNDSGVPLSGGKLYSYAAGTTIPQATYTSASGSTAHTNPIILNSAGRVATGEIWLTSAQIYKFALYTSTDVLIATWDNIDGIAPSTVFADFANTSDVAKGDALVGFKQSNAAGVLTGAVAGTVHTKLQEFVSAKDFGAVGNGTTNETSTFATLESGTTGAAINLLNGIYLVDSVPTGNNYYNGAFKIGTDIFWQNRNPRAHPFEGPATSVRHINPRTGTYCGLNVAIFIKSDNNMVFVWREAITHAIQEGSRLKTAWTDDGGRTLNPYPNGSNPFPPPSVYSSLQTIYTTPTADTRNFASNTIIGRFLLVAVRVEEPQSSPTYQDPLVVYSDDEGLTWSNTTITGLTNKTINFHGKLYPWSGGGADGVVLFYYASGGVGALTSSDKGANWTDLGIVVPTTVEFPTLTEMSVTQIGSQNKWVMVIRTSTNQNFAVSTSNNLTTWTSAVNSGVLLGRNPPELAYADGKLWMIAVSRRNLTILPGYDNALLIAEGNPELIYSSGGINGWSGWKVVSQLGFWPTGYLSTAQVRGRWYALMTASEEAAGSTVSRTSFLAMISSDLVDVADTRTILEAVPQDNLIVNGMLDYWPNGDTFAFAAGQQRTLVTPDFTFARQSAVDGATISRIAGQTQRYAMSIRRDDGDTQLENMVLVHTLTQSDSAKFKYNQATQVQNEFFSFQFRCRKGSGFSAANNFLIIQIIYSENSVEEQITSLNGLFAPPVDIIQSANVGIYPTENWEDYFITYGGIPPTATQFAIRFVWEPTGTAVNDYVDLEALSLFVGKQRSPVVKKAYSEIVNASLPFFWTGTVRSENGSRWISFPTIMHRTPTVTVSAGTASNISTLGFELSHSSAADITVKAQAWL